MTAIEICAIACAHISPPYNPPALWRAFAHAMRRCAPFPEIGGIAHIRALSRSATNTENHSND